MDMHVIVIGAGPAGFGAALGLTRKGMHVDMLEQDEVPGAVRRGETIRFDEHMERLLGGGFFDRIALRMVNRRRYYSHSGKKHVDRQIRNPNIIISWPDLIGLLTETVCREGVTLHAGTRALDLIAGENGQVKGVEARRGSEDVTFPGSTVLLCGGCGGSASMGITQDRSGMDMKVHKRLVTGFSGPEDRLEYHFHLAPSGLVVGTMFPRGGGEAEFILMDTSPGNTEALSFDGFRACHPLFDRLLKDTSTTYELQTFVPMGGMRYPFSPMTGLILAGDALGHVQARGGSGIRTSFLIGYAAGSLAADTLNAGGWTDTNLSAFEKAMRMNPHVRSLMMHNAFFGTLRKGIFGRIRSPENMDRLWPLLSLVLR
ncbi:MAG TPA: FAD-dependent oxidoreductase [Deltaproteobacteria bacterium]|nr:FAD-dependent oxidoreductase [Deltaproteobacteria bacterium]HPR55983.1 FAD-dependent oxidoreductase [Deltaproteobacteria bacterium]HXK46575.1 FAD-dependent oxidoreductase [Deltaproteobacteria bacterium]